MWTERWKTGGHFVQSALPFAQEKCGGSEMRIARMADSFQAFDQYAKASADGASSDPAIGGTSVPAGADPISTAAASLRAPAATPAVRRVRRRIGCPRIGVRSGMARQAISRRRFRAPQTSLTGRITVPPAREGDARDGRRRPATVWPSLVEACRASPAIRREFARDAADGRSGRAASPSGRREAP
jgi:hypothetical protein